ncbi:MAG TPA: carbamoyltransferase [Polyangiales bacterium]|nr:carbamoyltransferase [Polyangiales bacterium]
MDILGISAFYHDSAACLVRDGVIVAAAEEERFSRKKHDSAFPERAVAYCLAEANTRAADLELVVFYEKPLLKFERLLESYLAFAPAGFKLAKLGLPLWIRQRLHAPREVDRGLGGAYRGRYVFTEHHEAHAASAFLPSPFEEAAILTMDGVGEWATASIGHGRGAQVELLRELHFPHSLGLLYSALTYFVGFKVNSGEYKLMGLAPYGQPVYRERMLRELIELKDDGSFRLNLSYFAYGHDDVMTAPKLNALLDGPPRPPDAPLTQREADIAASIQSVLEDVVLRMAFHAHALTGSRRLVLAGGVALNCVANARLRRQGPFAELWVQPGAGDAGAAVGCALFAWHQLLGNPRPPRFQDALRGAYLGPAYTQAEARAELERLGASFSELTDEGVLCDRIAELLAQHKVVGHFWGRMEFGPRALGNRSILADARAPDMQAHLNAAIKFRESFRPFAPAVLREDAASWFDMGPNDGSPYMQFTVPVHTRQRRGCDPSVVGLDRSAQLRSTIPAVTHVDHSARVQTVEAAHNPRLHAILRAFKQRTGCPLLINTSFNVRGEPIVASPADAYGCFMHSGLDALVIQNCLLLKADQPATLHRAPQQFPPD